MSRAGVGGSRCGSVTGWVGEMTTGDDLKRTLGGEDPHDGRSRARVVLDPATPNVARIYDHLLGGKDNYEADRQAARELLDVIPDVAVRAQENRVFLSRVVRFLAEEAGIRQFIDGSWVWLFWRGPGLCGECVAGAGLWVVSLVFAGEVVGPVVGRVAVGADGAEFEDGFGALGAPPGSGDAHAVFDQVAAGAFDDAGGDGPAVGEGGGVVQEGSLGFQVAGAFSGDVALVLGQVCGGGGLGADGGGDAGGVAVQDGAGVRADPGRGAGAGLGVEAPGGVPQVFGDVDEVDDDGDIDAAGGCSARMWAIWSCCRRRARSRSGGGRGRGGRPRRTPRPPPPRRRRRRWRSAICPPRAGRRWRRWRRRGRAGCHRRCAGWGSDRTPPPPRPSACGCGPRRATAAPAVWARFWPRGGQRLAAASPGAS